MAKTKPKIFVSHSTKDNQFASKLVDDLNASGTKAWMDVNDLGAGNFQENVSKALADCEWFLLVLTRNALESDWVRMEVDAAIRLKNRGKIKELIFIKAAALDLGELPALWGVFNIFDASADYGRALEWTLKALGHAPTLTGVLNTPVNGRSPALETMLASKAYRPDQMEMLVAEKMDEATSLLGHDRTVEAWRIFGEVIRTIEHVVVSWRDDGYDTSPLREQLATHYAQAWRGKADALERLGHGDEASKARIMAVQGWPF